jgi:hypothetical protein
MKFPNASNVPVNMMYPTDFSYWEKLKAFVDYEPVEAIAPEVRGILASIGIIKGVPFNPDAQARQTLTRAVETAPKMIFAWKAAGRADGADRYYTDRQWLNVWAGTDAGFFRQTYLDIDQRASFFQYVYSSAPAMGTTSSTMVPSIPARTVTATAICLTAAATTNCTCLPRSRPRPFGR